MRSVEELELPADKRKERILARKAEKVAYGRRYCERRGEALTRKRTKSVAELRKNGREERTAALI